MTISHHLRQAQLLDVVLTQGGEWTTSRVQQLYRDSGISAPLRSTARKDLHALQTAGHLIQHDDKGRRFSRPPAAAPAPSRSRPAPTASRSPPRAGTASRAPTSNSAASPPSSNRASSKGDALTFWAGNITAETAMNNLPYLVSSSLHPTSAPRPTTGCAAPTSARRTNAPTSAPPSTAHRGPRVGHPDARRAPHRPRDGPVPRPLPPLRRGVAGRVRGLGDGRRQRTPRATPGRSTTCSAPRSSPPRSPRTSTATSPPRACSVGDTKTGGELDVKGVYPEAALQMSAYRKARRSRGSGTARRSRCRRTFWAGVVLHLRPEGYRLIPAVADDAVFEAFLTSSGTPSGHPACPSRSSVPPHPPYPH
jgi:hypothetical protein